MATSSITHNFVIRGKRRVEAFAKALEASFNTEVPELPALGREVTDSDEAWAILREALARRKSHG